MGARGGRAGWPGWAGLEPSLRRRDRLRRAEGRARALRGAVAAAAAAARGAEMAAEREARRLLSTSSSRHCCPTPLLLLLLLPRPLLSGAAAVRSGSPPQSAGKWRRARDAVGAGARHRLPPPLRWGFLLLFRIQRGACGNFSVSAPVAESGAGRRGPCRGRGASGVGPGALGVQFCALYREAGSPLASFPSPRLIPLVRVGHSCAHTSTSRGHYTPH